MPPPCRNTQAEGQHGHSTLLQRVLRQRGQVGYFYLEAVADDAVAAGYGASLPLPATTLRIYVGDVRPPAADSTF